MAKKITLESLDKKFDRIVNYLFDVQDKKIDRLDKKIDKRFDQILTILDKHTIILKRLDQERLFTLERIKRLEADVLTLKRHLGIS